MASVVIIGAGPGGYEAALVAAQLGARVTIVDAGGPGGSAVLTDCVPSKTLIATADLLAVTAEESGLLGSKYYAENPVFPLAQTVGGVNMDALNAIGPAKDIVVVGRGKSELDTYLEKIVKAANVTIVDEPTPEKGFYYRSDHFSFAKLGVPMLYIDGGQDLVEGGRAAGEAVAKDYTDNRYHGPKDEFDESWDWSGVMADLQLYYRLGRMMAMSTSWPNWRA